MAPANPRPVPPIVGLPVPPVAANSNKRTVADIAREEVEQADHEEAQADLMDVDENDGPPAPNEELSEDDDQGLEEGNPQKKPRNTRKKTWWLFVEQSDISGQVICLCGCLSSDNSKRLVYSGPNTGLVKRHILLKHKYLHDEYLRCKNGDGNFNRIEETVDALNKKTLESLRIKRRRSDQFFKSIIDTGMDKYLKANLKLLMWSVANNVPRIALNDSLFDSYLNDIGAPAAPNRHSLQEDYLPQLDRLVVDEIMEELKCVTSVSLSADGYRDRVRRDWVNVTIYWIISVMGKEKKEVWAIRLAKPDLLYLPESATAENIATLVNAAVDEFVPPTCLKATMTTDGAANEHAAAVDMVNEGNELHCADHNVQLAMNDNLDPKKANPPATCAVHREIIRKCHDLVIFINGHKDTFYAFSELAKAKRGLADGNRQFQALVIDNDTRWDSKLGLLERLVYFDTEILQMGTNRALGIPPECLLNRLEFDIAHGMTLVLLPFRIFTKFFENRSIVTLAELPHKVDSLISALAPGSFAERMAGRSPGALESLELLQTALVISLKERFGYVFLGDSVSLEALMLMPGKNRFQFSNFQVNEDTLRDVKSHLMNDFKELLPPNMPENLKILNTTMGSATLELARTMLDALDEATNPLEWWPSQSNLSALFPLAKMLFSIPASTSEDERTFSSAGFTLDKLRTRMDLDNFRREHRIRQFMVAGTDPHHQDGRALREERALTLINRLGILINQAKGNNE